MNWINIHTDTLRSESYLGADPVERATWLNLMAWCCSQENSGTIKGAADWPDRKWQQLCGVTKEEATLVSELYRLGTNGDLTVSLYPIDKQEEVANKRLTAKANGKKGGRPPKETQPEPTLVISENLAEPILQTVKRREGKEKGREKKDKEKEIPPNPQGGIDGKTRKELKSALELKAESIYNEYPRKVGKSAAIKAILKALKYETHETLITAVQAYCKAIERKDRQFIPHPATWFSQGRYNDDPAEWEESAPKSKGPAHREGREEIPL